MTPLKWRYFRPVQENTSALAGRSPGELLDGVGEMLVRDIIGTPPEPDMMRFAQHIGVSIAHGRVEFVAGKFEKKTKGITEVDRVHETAVDLAGVGNIPLLQPLEGLGIGGARYREGEMVEAAGGRGYGR